VSRCPSSPLLRLLAWLFVLASALPATPTRVTLQLKWKHQWQFAGYYAALEQGYYREAGLEVSLREAPEIGAACEPVLRGEAEFGIADSDLVLMRAQGKPVVSLAVIFQHSPLALIALEGRGIRSVHDLAGRKLLFEPGAEELQAYLIREGMPMNRFRIVSHAFDESALLDGTADAMTAYTTDEPFPLRNAGLSYLTFTPRASGIDFYGDTLFTTTSVVRRSPKMVQAFKEASLKGWRYALTHREELADLILAKYSRRHSREHLLFEAEESCRLILPEVVELGYQYEGRWLHIAEVYQSLGLVHRLPDLRTFIHQPRPGIDPRSLYIAGGSLLVALLVGLVALYFFRLNANLRTALEEVKTLSGLLPICAGCKKIRDDQGFWTQVEGYIQERSSATFTHGLCPDCQEVYFPSVNRRGNGKSRVGQQ